jgi:fatty acid desaturase
MRDDRDLFETGLLRESARQRLSGTLGEDTIRRLQKRSDLQGAIGVANCWLAISLLLGVAWLAMDQLSYLSIPVVALCVLFIGGRILALAILTHEGAHRTLFANSRLNDAVTHWLCAAPVYLDLIKYRHHHAQHHIHTGTDKDVDLPLIEGFPTNQKSLMRKFIRDFTGQTGLKSLIGLAMMNAELIRWNVTGVVDRLERPGWQKRDHLRAFFINSRRTLIFHTVFFVITFSLNLTELFALWWAAYLFTYPFCIRVRAIAEHAVTERTGDMLKNTRTTRAGIMARALFAPCHVNFHIEHHALVSVPFWQLPELHRLMQEYKITPPPPSYWQVLKTASSAR